MKFIKVERPLVILIEPQVYNDERGFFLETFRVSLFKDNGINYDFVQENHSGSKKNVLRGLHYQVVKPQGKLVRVVKGEVFDVAVDLRRSSVTFGQWVSEVLSEDNKRILWIPPGFAHGFYVLSDWAEVIYKTTEYYSPEYERTIIWNDPDIGIKWPISDNVEPILSEKDKKGKYLKEAEVYD